jgi:hypothetical protein
MIPKIAHLHSYLSNKTTAWCEFDNEELFNHHMSIPSKAVKILKFGWDKPGKISYIYNSHGFRTPEFSDIEAGLALGCSFTEGLGLPVENTWPSVLSNILDFPIWNLGVSASSSDSCFRLLDHYINYLNIKFVAVCVPHHQRFEFFDLTGVLQTVIPEEETPKYAMPYYKNWISFSQNSLINQRKNLLSIQKICEDKKIKLVCLDYTEYDINSKSDLARDLAHPGIESNKNFAQKVLKKL